MRRLQSFLTALAFASCLSAACGTNSDRVAAPTPVDSGTTPEQPTGTDPSRPPAPPTPPSTEPRPPEHPDRCDHRKAQWAVGKAASRELLEKARVAAGAETARFLRLGEPTTLEYRFGRLNLSVDAQDIVRRVECW